MKIETDANNVQKLKKNKKHKGVISFDKEIVTKDEAVKLISVVDVTHEKKNSKRSKHSESQKESKPHKSGKPKYVENGKLNVESETNEPSQKKVKRKKKMKEINGAVIKNETSNEEQVAADIEVKANKKRKKVTQLETEEDPEANSEVTVENTKEKKGESIRAQKRKKHAKLLEEKRLKSEIVSQQNVLNYLSKWKHSRDEWKFEKLKQIWLQQNLFDCSKIPDEFWETIVEYFSGSKGFIRKVVIRDALKIIEKQDNEDEENTDEDYLRVLKRARDIIQHLQE